MRAKVKRTGEIITVGEFDQDGYGLLRYRDCSHEEHIEYNAWELDFDVHEIDWEQRRFELVKAAMQGMMSSNLSTQEIVWQSIEMADAIIKGLKSEVELPDKEMAKQYLERKLNELYLLYDTDVKARYVFDEPCETYFVEISPKELLKSDKYINWENKTLDEFINKFPYNICFLDADEFHEMLEGGSK